MGRLISDLECNQEANNPLDVFIAIFIAFGILFSYIPQHYKIISTKSSDGISPWFLLLGAISMTCSFFNILILQVHEIECCQYESARLCFENTLGVIQLSLQWIMFTMILVLFIVYFPERKKYIPSISLSSEHYSLEWRISLQVAASVAIHFLFTIIVSAYLVKFVGRAEEKETTRYWADLLGIVSLILASVQYLPQLWRTWIRKTVGALSIPMMMIQTPGSFLFVYSLATRPGTRWSTWVVFLITGCLQGILLIMCICWHFKERRERRERDEVVVDSHPVIPNERTRLLNET